MKPFEIYTTFISRGSGGKNRPVLVLLLGISKISVFPVTTQYEDKSDAVRARYFRINGWSQVGLAKQSYVDTGTLLNLPLTAIGNTKPLGKLTIADKKRLLEFLAKNP
jgi:hypothetical protein